MMQVVGAAALVLADTDRRANKRVEAALRVVVFASVAVTALMERSWRYTDLPASLRFGVPGPGVPAVSSTAVAAATVLLVVCCVYAAIGRRWAAAAAAPLGWLVLGVPQMYGKVNHYHHLLWLAVLYAVMSPRSVLRWAWPIMGVVYLFPGLAKLEHSGELVDGGMERLIEGHQWVRGWDAPLSVTGTLAAAAAVGTILFEVCFIFGGMTRNRRWWAAAGLGFHVAVFVVMGIVFWPAFAILAVLFFDRSEPSLDWQPIALVVLAGAAMAGLLDKHGWPFAPYPPFTSAPTERSVLEVRNADGAAVEWLEWIPNARRNGVGSRILAEPALCEVVAPEGGSCWRIVGRVTPDGIQVVAQVPLNAETRT